jgi:hypothetical protein
MAIAKKGGASIKKGGAKKAGGKCGRPTGTGGYKNGKKK